MPRLEDFQAGIPLNEELAQLKAGLADEEAVVEDGAWQQSQALDDVDKPLTETDREDMRRLLREPGWRILERLRKRTLRALEQKAILVSQINPLGNREEIANGWAYLTVAKQTMKAEAAMVQAEAQGTGNREQEPGNED